ncbi:MAG: hypothetical protein ACKVP0_24865 [Pirellulaceae bacterium]
MNLSRNVLLSLTIMYRHLLASAFVLTTFIASFSPLGAAEIAILTEKNWDEFVPKGKEVDCIYGDYVLRNDKIVAVIAQPLATRNANMTVRGVGGMIIDLTQRQAQNDQLSAYYAGEGNISSILPRRSPSLSMTRK